MANPGEVERVFDVALAELADLKVFHEERWRIAGRTIPGTDDDSFAIRFFEVSGEMIWGATARMIHELLERGADREERILSGRRRGAAASSRPRSRRRARPAARS